MGKLDRALSELSEHKQDEFVHNADVRSELSSTNVNVIDDVFGREEDARGCEATKIKVCKRTL